MLAQGSEKKRVNKLTHMQYMRIVDHMRSMEPRSFETREAAASYFATVADCEVSVGNLAGILDDNPSLNAKVIVGGDQPKGKGAALQRIAALEAQVAEQRELIGLLTGRIDALEANLRRAMSGSGNGQGRPLFESSGY